MVRLFVFVLFSCCILSADAQAQSSATPIAPLKFAPLDKSPMDISYYPANYPVLKIQDKATEPLVARVIYSRPQKENRTIFGDLIEYNKVWRLGANEATEIEFYREVKIKDKKVPKGRYTLYAVPTTGQWTIILNKETDIWGSFRYDESKDFLRVSLPVQKLPAPVEALSMNFNKSTTGADLIIAWDDVMVSLPLTFK